MVKRISISLFIASVLFLIGCNCNHNSESVVEPQLRDYSIQSVLWQQNAGEYRALCYQAYNIAQLRLDQYLAQEENQGKQLAIITDIDETIMDNSMYNARLIIENKDYTPEDWTEWVEREEAWALPGSVAFMNYAEEKGVEVFYVTNRVLHEGEATIKNMKTLGFPYADEEHVILKDEDSSKKDRFDKVREDYTVLLYIGDNLSDFKSDFRVPSTEDRNQLVEKRQNEFGLQYIMLPNPMYGDWESRGLYEGRYDWTIEQKDSIWRSNLKFY